MRSLFLRGGFTGALGQRVPAADDLRRIIETQFAVHAGKLILQWRGHQRFVDGQHDHLVIGEQTPPLDSRTERKPVKLRTVDGFVVHRRQLGRMLFGLVLDRLVEDPRRRRHVQPAGGLEELGIVDADEVRIVLPPEQGDAGGAVRFVADHQVERIHPPSSCAFATAGRDW